MKGSEFAGALRTRVTLLTPTAADDPDGDGEDWTVRDVVWAALAPEGKGALFAGDARAALPLWRVTLRLADLTVGDRITWPGGTIEVREVRIDPALPDRIVAIGEERR